jgi:hypothetical protein
MTIKTFTRNRNTRTDLEIVNSGEFVKVARKHFRHVSGLEITFDCNRCGWRISDETGWVWPNLHAAVSQVRGVVAGRR